MAQTESVAAIRGLRREQDAVQSLQPAHRAAPPEDLEFELRYSVRRRGGSGNAVVGRSGHIAEVRLSRRESGGARTGGSRCGGCRDGGPQNLCLRLWRDRAPGEAAGKQLLASLLEEGERARLLAASAAVLARRYREPVDRRD